MDYEEFDKDESPDEIRYKIIDLLKEKPLTRKELFANIKAVPSRINQQMKRLRAGNRIAKRWDKGEWYYGLLPKYRTDNYRTIQENGTIHTI